MIDDRIGEALKKANKELYVRYDHVECSISLLINDWIKPKLSYVFIYVNCTLLLVCHRDETGKKHWQILKAWKDIDSFLKLDDSIVDVIMQIESSDTVRNYNWKLLLSIIQIAI